MTRYFCLNLHSRDAFFSGDLLPHAIERCLCYDTIYQVDGGDYYLYEPCVPCGYCSHCKSGKSVLCPNQWSPYLKADCNPHSKHLFRVRGNLGLSQLFALFLHARIHSLFQKLHQYKTETILIHGGTREAFLLWLLLRGSSLVVESKRVYKRYKKQGKLITLEEIPSANYHYEHIVLLSPDEVTVIPTVLPDTSIHYFSSPFERLFSHPDYSNIEQKYHQRNYHSDSQKVPDNHQPISPLDSPNRNYSSNDKKSQGARVQYKRHFMMSLRGQQVTPYCATSLQVALPQFEKQRSVFPGFREVFPILPDSSSGKNSGGSAGQFQRINDMSQSSISENFSGSPQNLTDKLINQDESCDDNGGSYCSGNKGVVKLQYSPVKGTYSSSSYTNS